MSEPVAHSPSRNAAPAVRSVILLAGQVGRNPFADGVGRSILDLPVEPGRTVLDVWLEQLDGLARALDLSRLHVCVSVDRTGHLPRATTTAECPRVEIEAARDAGEYRGTAGVVKDLTKGYGDDDWVMVGAANQMQRESLVDVFEALKERGESVSVVPSGDGEVAGMFLLRCARLKDVPEVGFVDLKEQAIPAARGHAPLAVVRRPAGSLLPVRTLAEYVRTLRVIHGGGDANGPGASREDPFGETWKSVFSIVESGAQVAGGAILQDAVVLAGGVVERGAVVARSVVCAGGTVQRGQHIVESIVTEHK